MHKDPVCGKRINRGKAHAIAEYEGVAYFLCCPLCQTQFEQTPKTYAQPELGEKVKKGSSQVYSRRQRSMT
jgi:YHS domain-containing protein